MFKNKYIAYIWSHPKFTILIYFLHIVIMLLLSINSENLNCACASQVQTDFCCYPFKTELSLAILQTASDENNSNRTVETVVRQVIFSFLIKNVSRFEFTLQILTFTCLIYMLFVAEISVSVFLIANINFLVVCIFLKISSLLVCSVLGILRYSCYEY